MKKYDKKVTVSLTEKDHTTLQAMADDDRRHINQMASMLIEDDIANHRLVEDKHVS